MEIAPTDDDLYQLFLTKYGEPDQTGWSPRQRLKFGYYQPGDYYDAVVNKLVTADTSWVDVGGGRAIFPQNENLSKQVAQRCKRLIAVDPSPNVREHDYAHDYYQTFFEDLETEERFDLATFRMVAEHIVNPDAVLLKLREIMKPNGVVVIYTINKFSPVPIVTYLTPFSVHFKVKKLIWGGEEKDTFPVAYKMNTRNTLHALFTKHGFVEEEFRYLDDLSSFKSFKFLNKCELVIWKALNSIGLRYPENNLLGIYRLP